METKTKQRKKFQVRVNESVVEEVLKLSGAKNISVLTRELYQKYLDSYFDVPSTEIILNWIREHKTIEEKRLAFKTIWHMLEIFKITDRVDSEMIIAFVGKELSSD